MERKRRLNRMTYAYPVLIVGNRRYNYSRYSDGNRTLISDYVSNNTISSTSPSVDSTHEYPIMSRSKRQTEDLDAAASGYGGHSYCPEGIPIETALFAVLGAAALSFGILFMAITMITGGKRKRREVDHMTQNAPADSSSSLHYSHLFSDLIYQGSDSFS